ncbi:MAG: glycosyltransferase family 39 protein [Acidobacteriota bacterium]|nr:glycosyltransferase family 39 protein [Acidobacteriota bacterium]
MLGVILLLKCLVVWELRNHPLLHPDAGLDTTAYVSLARQVAAGDLALGPGLYFVSPLYIYVLAAGLALFDSFTAVRLMQVLLGTLSVGGIFLMARAWFTPRAAWIAATLAGVTGMFTFYEVIVLQSSIDAFLTSAALTALTFALKPLLAELSSGSSVFRLRSFVFCLSGAVFGIAALNRPNMLLAAAAVFLALAVARRFLFAVLLAAGVLAGLAPVTIRNAVVAGQWSLVSSHGGLNAYIGNNENATGFYREVPGIRPLIEGQQEDVRRVASERLGRPVSDAEASSYFTGLTRAWVMAHPMQAAALFAKKLYYTFHAQHVALPHSYPFFAYDTGSSLRYLFVGPWLLVPLGLAGLLFAPGAVSRERYLVWLAFVPGYAIGVAAFFVAERYRLPLLVPLCVGAGAAIDAAWRAIAARRVRPVTPLLASAAVIAVIVNWPLPLDDGRWDDGLRTAQRLVITGHYDEADGWVSRLEAGTRRLGRAHHGVGMQLVVQAQPARALSHLKRSLERGFAANDDPEVWLRLGRLSARNEGPAAAEPFFRRGAELGAARAGARQQYGLNLLVMERWEDARRELREAVRLAPGDADSLAHLAYCEIKLGDAVAAREHVRAALQADATHALARQLAAALGLD